MKRLTLRNHVQSDAIIIENAFIDRYMTAANGEYVKVYLLLLRHLNGPSGSLPVSEIADLLDLTEKDVVRALKYWKKQGLLDYEDDRGVSVAETKEPVSPEAPDGPSDISDLQQFKSRREFKELMFVAEQYLGKTLSATDINTIAYFYDSLHMSPDLIEYLIEYCVENGHRSMHYIKKVAQSWIERQITTVEDAKAGTLLYNKNCYSILNAFGIKGRAPAASELLYIRKWNEEQGFSLDIILEACRRTIASIHQPSFEYTDSILTSWQDKGVRRLSDVEAADAEHLKEKERKKKQPAKAAASKNKFNNFDGRSYDMNTLERQLIQ